MTRVRAAAALAACAVLAACSSGAGRTAATPTTARSPATTPAGGGRPRRSAGCATRTAAPRGISQHTLRSGGVTRVYELDIPSDYDGTRPFALVLGLHALTVDYRFVPSMSGFDQGAAYHFIGVAPSGRVDGTTPFWMAAPTPANYDVDFISHLLDQLEAELCIDTARVFAAGMSNGAQMSSLLACRLSGRVAAISPVAGVEFPEPCPGRPVPILAFHGTKDPILPYKGGGLSATRIADLYYWKGKVPKGTPAPLGVDESMRRWARHNGCRAAYIEQRISRHVVRRSWSHCRAATVLYIVEGGGHAWPGHPVPGFESSFGHTTTEIDATKLMFQFFFGAPHRLR